MRGLKKPPRVTSEQLPHSCSTTGLETLLICSASSVPDLEKLNDLTKIRWLLRDTGRSPNSWAKSSSVNFSDIARHPEHNFSWSTCTQIFFLKSREQPELPVSLVRLQILSLHRYTPPHGTPPSSGAHIFSSYSI